MFNPFQNTLHPQAQYSVIMQATPGYKGIKNRENKDQDWFFYMATRLVSFLGILCVIMSIVWVSTVMFVDNKNRLGYETTTFYTTIDRNNIDSWQVQTQSWSDISKSNIAVDNQFNHYFECWFAAGVAADRCANTTINSYKTCINSRFATELALCSSTNNADQIAPTLNSYSQCINNKLLPTRESINGLKICLRTSMWPLFESPENVDSWQFLGSYNWMTLLSIGFALFSCFVLYTGGFVMYAENLEIDSKTNEPKGNSPLSYSITGVCAGFSLIFLVYFLLNAYRLSDSNAMGSTYPFPNSVATNNVMIPATLLVFVYFVLEFLEAWHPYDETTKKKGVAGDAQMPAEVAQLMMAANGQILQKHMPRQYFNPTKDSSTDPQWYGVMTTYYPALTLAWADAYMLDPIIALGVIGATHQISTAMAYQVFLAILTYRLAHTSVARLLYAGYIVNPDENPDKFASPDRQRNVIYSIRMQAMFMHLAASFALIMLWYILTNTNSMISEYSLIYSMLFLWYLIPETIRLIAHVTVASKGLTASDRYVLITCNYIVWIWDVLIRFIFVMIIIWGATTIYATQGFITERLQNITETIAYMNA